MPKLKTHSGAKKRFNLTKTGKVKRAHAFKSHILTKKDRSLIHISHRASAGASGRTRRSVSATVPEKITLSCGT